MKMKKVVSVLLAGAMAATLLAGCSSSSSDKKAEGDAKGKVYYLNFKPEADEQWQACVPATRGDRRAWLQFWLVIRSR